MPQTLVPIVTNALETANEEKAAIAIQKLHQTKEIQYPHTLSTTHLMSNSIVFRSRAKQTSNAFGQIA